MGLHFSLRSVHSHFFLNEALAYFLMFHFNVYRVLETLDLNQGDDIPTRKL